MFLRIIFRGNKCGKENLYLYGHFDPLCIEHSNPWLRITPKEIKINGVMMSQGKKQTKSGVAVL